MILLLNSLRLLCFNRSTTLKKNKIEIGESRAYKFNLQVSVQSASVYLIKYFDRIVFRGIFFGVLISNTILALFFVKCLVFGSFKSNPKLVL